MKIFISFIKKIETDSEFFLKKIKETKWHKKLWNNEEKLEIIYSVGFKGKWKKLKHKLVEWEIS